MTPDGTVTVPINIDTRPGPKSSGGLMEATLALRYDPRIFSVTAADIKLGAVPSSGSGWQLTAAINPATGEIGITLFSTTPIQNTAGGSLVTITLKTVGGDNGSAVSSKIISLVNQVDPTGHGVFTTTLADSQGGLVVDINSGQPAVNSGQWAAGSGQLMVGDAVVAVDKNVVHTQITGHTSLPVARYVEQVFAEAGGMAWEDNAWLPQQEPSYLLPAEDWAQLLSVMGIDPATSQAGDSSLLLAHTVVADHWDDAEPDADLTRQD